MATNIEIKAQVHNFERMKERAEQLSDTPVELIKQRDTFFHTPQGRLKLRQFTPTSGQLIYYQRHNDTGPTRSDYYLVATQEPLKLEKALSAAWGVRGVVIKERLLYLVGQTRIHLDRVEGLGCFLELEVVMRKGQSMAEGEAIAQALMRQLDIGGADLLDLAYIDLLERKG